MERLLEQLVSMLACLSCVVSPVIVASGHVSSTASFTCRLIFQRKSWLIPRGPLRWGGSRRDRSCMMWLWLRVCFDSLRRQDECLEAAISTFPGTACVVDRRVWRF
uniref:Secreted protein n=1 Tax=Mesocestoides corti TaxID=53468 RepID=A0A5K3FVM9_MESCO